MIQGLYAAANGMMAVEARQDAIANNIANASTTGFKSVAPVELGFYQTLSQKLRKPFHYEINPAPAGGAGSGRGQSSPPGGVRGFSR